MLDAERDKTSKGTGNGSKTKPIRHLLKLRFPAQNIKTCKDLP